MSSTLRPLTSSPQNPSNSNQINKAMHPQGAPTYGQPGHMAQGMVNLHPNTNLAHTHPNTQQHHYLNVPNASGHYMNQSMGQIPASNHPVPNPTSGSTVGVGGGQMYNAPPTKGVPYIGGGYQHQPAQNMGHSVNVNQSALPPVSQTLPPSAPPHVPPTISPPTSSVTVQQTDNLSTTNTPSTITPAERPQSNGTQETKVTSKVVSEQQQQNYVPTVKEKPAVVQQASTPVVPVQTAQPPPIISDKPPEKPKPPSAPEPINRPEVTKPPDTPPSNAPTPPMSNSESNSNSPTLIEKPVVPQPVTPPAISSGTPEKVAVADGSAEATVDGKIVEENKEISPVTQSESSENSNASSEEKTEDSTKEQTNIEVPTEDTEKSTVSIPQEQTVTKREPSPAKIVPPLPNTPRTPTRKSKTPKPEETPSLTQKPTKEVKTLALKSPSTGKAKRQRIRTQPYQSPLPELEIITKITASATPRGKNTDDKLIVFYKNEFLAVRNAEGSFYLCQAVQNIYKSSSKIKIRWLSQDKSDKSGEIYTPDFYDLTDFDCILTNLSMRRVDKGKYRLPNAEKERTESILNRSLAVEKGEVTSPSLTEEHPDGLDLSLYKAEDQLKKNKRRTPNRKRGRKPSKSPVKKETPTRKAPEAPKVRKLTPRAPPPPKKATVAVKKPPPAPPKRLAPPTRVAEPAKKAPVSASSTRSGRGVAGKRKASGGANEKPKTSPVVDHKKAKVLARIGRKAAVAPAVPASKVAASKKTAGKAAKPAPVASSSKRAAASTKTSTKAAKLPATRSGKRTTRK